MAPKEKAEDIWLTFYQLLPDGVYSDYAAKEEARKFSLIAVDEIINSREEDSSFDDTLSSTSSEYYTPHPMYLTYWLQVKQEIEKL